MARIRRRSRRVGQRVPPAATARSSTTPEILDLTEEETRRFLDFKRDNRFSLTELLNAVDDAVAEGLSPAEVLASATNGERLWKERLAARGIQFEETSSRKKTKVGRLSDGVPLEPVWEAIADILEEFARVPDGKHLEGQADPRKEFYPGSGFLQFDMTDALNSPSLRHEIRSLRLQRRLSGPNKRLDELLSRIGAAIALNSKRRGRRVEGFAAKLDASRCYQEYLSLSRVLRQADRRVPRSVVKEKAILDRVQALGLSAPIMIETSPAQTIFTNPLGDLARHLAAHRTWQNRGEYLSDRATLWLLERRRLMDWNDSPVSSKDLREARSRVARAKMTPRIRSAASSGEPIR